MTDNIMFIPACVLMVVEAGALIFLICAWIKANREQKMANEKRLIDANAYAYPEDLINEPTVDAVEVVRCKDCKHYSRDEMFGVGYCYGAEKKLDDFCSYGERK